MPVYPAHELVHIHIPKTGGTAIGRCFQKIGDRPWTAEFCGGQEHKDGRWYEHGHLTMQELRRLSGTTWDAYDSFALVRNPYARTLSDYLWRERIRVRYPGSATQFFDSFDAFVRAIPGDMGARWPDRIQGADQSWANFLIHVRPQHQFIIDEEGRRLVNHVFRFEHLPRDVHALLARHGANGATLQAPPERDLAAYYDRTLLDLVNEIYAADFEHFSYEQL